MYLAYPNDAYPSRPIPEYIYSPCVLQDKMYFAFAFGKAA